MKSFWSPAASLQGRILLFVLGTTLVAALAALVFVVQVRRVLEAQILASQSALAQSYAGVVEKYLDGARGAIELAARTATIQTPPDLAAIQPELRGVAPGVDPVRRDTLAALIAIWPRFEYVFQLAPNGDMYMLQPYDRQVGLPRLDFAFRDYYQRAVAARATAWSDLYLSVFNQQPVVAVATPIYDAGGELSSVFGGTLRLDLLADVANAIPLGQTGAVLLFDGQGRPIVDRDPTRRATMQPLTEVPLVSDALSGRHGAWVYWNPLAQRTELGAVYPVAGTGWYAAVVQADDEAFAAVNRLTLGLLLVLALGAGLLAALGYLLARSLAAGVRQVGTAARQLARDDLPSLVQVARALADGDLGCRPRVSAQRLPVRGKDEIGQMTTDFNQIVDGLHDTAAAFTAMTGQLRTITVALRAASAELMVATREIQGAVVQQSTGASEQAAAIRQTSVTVQQVAASAEQISQTATALDAAATRATAVSGSGLAAVRDAVASMQAIELEVAAVAERIVQLAERGQEIGTIITTVHDIADQSDLLALNAALEAARAGEHGRGFMVVASEGRRLAEQSKAATRQVRLLLSDVQRATGAAVAATEQSTERVASGARQIQQAGQTIEGLAAVIDQAAAAARRIAAEAREHSTGMVQIAAAMHDLNQATGQQVAATGQTEQAANGVAALAQRLDGLVAHYRVEAPPHDQHNGTRSD